MREMFQAALVASIILCASFAGCVDPDGQQPDTQQDADLLLEDGEAELLDDAVYRLGTSRVPWDYADLNVLIVPPAYGQLGETEQLYPYDSLFLRAVEDSITHWQEVVDEHASAELRGNLTFTVNVLGRDIFVPDGPDDVDILIVHPPGGRLEAAGEKVLLGGVAWTPYSDSPVCVIGNLVHPLLSYEWLFMVSAHEFGHCLGLAHPDDMEPWNDLMSYTERNQRPGEPLPELECVSNMNLAGVHKAFAHVFGLEVGQGVEMPASEYEIYDCWQRFHPDAQ